MDDVAELKKEIKYLSCYKDAALKWREMKVKECVSMAEKRRMQISADQRLLSALEILDAKK
jgi:hypothetical protein